jgi:hypothetical protein
VQSRLQPRLLLPFQLEPTLLLPAALAGLGVGSLAVLAGAASFGLWVSPLEWCNSAFAG